MIDKQSKKIITYLLIFAFILIAVAQIFPWLSLTTTNQSISIFEPHGSDTYPWGSREPDEINYFYDYLNSLFDLLELEGESLEDIEIDLYIYLILGFFLFPLSIITLIYGIYITSQIKNNIEKSGKLAKHAGIFGFMTIGCLIYFRHTTLRLNIPEEFLHWGIGFFLFLIGSILYVAAAIYTHYKTE